MRLLASLAAVLALVAFGASPALAADGDITWAVHPSDGSAADGRPWVEQELDPGASAEEHLVVENYSDEQVTFRLTAADGIFRENGRFSMLNPDEESTDAGTWITVAPEVTVDARSSAVVPFSTTVPDDATPGDHAAGIAASVVMQRAAEDGTSVGVESRVGFRVMTRVTGTLEPRLRVDDPHADYSLSWNPFRAGRGTITFTAVNAGNTRLELGGSISLGGQTAPVPEGQELLPGDSRTITVSVPGVWPLVYATGSIDISSTVTGIGEGTEVAPVTASIGTWAWPLPQIAVLVGIALIVFAIVSGRIRSRRRLAVLLAEAREEGRREAGA